MRSRLLLFCLIPHFFTPAIAEKLNEDMVGAEHPLTESMTASDATDTVTTDTPDECLLKSLKAAENSATAEDIRLLCAPNTAQAEPLESRNYLEEKNTANKFAITPHKPNYFLPLSNNSHPNSRPYIQDGNTEQLDRTEFLFQLSMKVAIWEKVLGHRSNLFLAYTNRSWWQAYNKGVSSPFRESNHEPEMFLSLEPHWSLGSWQANSFTVGISHQSNGRSLPLSRSWDRLYLSAGVEKNNWVITLKPWYRIPEGNKDSPSDTSGDDNPDIEFYMGNFELLVGKRSGNQNISALIRNNLRSDNRGAIQLDWSFPLWETTKLRGYVQYFNGYGESLIDYNARSNRISVGVIMTEWF